MHKSLILLLETATSSCSVALSENGAILAIKELNEKNIHASSITLFIDEVMQMAGKKYSDLNAVAVSKGPGSYTGLRIGVSTAKGLCYALDIPLLGIDTLQAMAYGLLQNAELSAADLLIPMIDARRMEVYTAIFQADMEVVEQVNAKIVDGNSFDAYKGMNLVLFGDGAYKFRELFAEHSNIRLVDFENSAAHLVQQANEKLSRGEVENTAYFEPFYLKDFLPG